MLSETRLPHSLRLALFFLRVALGLSLFYLGWSVLFDHSLAAALRPHSLGGLYGWLAGPVGAGGIGGGSATMIANLPVPAVAFAWIFLVLGVLIAIGLFTRLASLAAIAVILISWLPSVSFARFDPAQFITDDLVAIFALIVIVLGQAGTYLGLDKFVRWSRRHKE